MEQFPVEINTAPYEMLLRVPGIGVRSAQRIRAARRCRSLDFDGLKKIGVVLKRAQYFITCSGKMREGLRFTPESVLRALISEEKQKLAAQDVPEQLSFSHPIPHDRTTSAGCLSGTCPKGGLTMVAYRYDGSFDGFLCCVFESYIRREVPVQILPEEEAQVSLYPEKWIGTDPDRAERVYTSLSRKISPEARELVETGFLTCLPERERLLYRFIRMGYRHGAQVTSWLADDTVSTLRKAAFSAGHEGPSIDRVSPLFRAKRHAGRHHHPEKPRTSFNPGAFQQPFQRGNLLDL